MTEHDVLVGFRLRLFTLADELGNVSAACRAMGVDRSTYYRLKAKVDRWGLEALNVRERRRPRMPNEIGPHLEQRIIAFALGHPGYGPRRIAAELAREKWGGLRISEHGVWRVLVRVGLNTRGKRLALIARHRDPYERRPAIPPPTRHIDATRPGEKVQLDCFFIGRLSGTKGSVWQYTAIDVASAYTWAELHATERNPRSRHTRELLPRRRRAGGRRLEAPGSHHGQWIGVPRPRVPCRRPRARRPPALHPRRTPQQQRLRRTRPTDHPRRMLAPRLRALPDPQDHRPGPRPQPVPDRLQHRPRPHRAPHPRPRARRHRLRRPQDHPRTMTTCRHNPGLGRPSPQHPRASGRCGGESG
jgi:transposase